MTHALEAPTADDSGPEKPRLRAKLGRLWVRMRLTGVPRPRAVIVTALAVGVSWTAILLARLFAGGVVGLADQGDGRRLLCAFGVANDRPWGAESSKFLYYLWRPHQWYGEACGADGSGEPYYSTQAAILAVAKWLGETFGLAQGIDLRIAGVVCACLLGVTLGLFVPLLPGALGFRILFVSAVGLIVADSAFAGFFISPYSEPAAFLGIVGLSVALLFMWRNGDATAGGAAAVTVVALFAIMSTTQMLSLVIPVVVALLWTPIRAVPRATGRHGLRQAARRERGPVRWLRRRWITLLLALAVLAGSLGYWSSQPQRFEAMNTYNAIFVEMLPHSPDPAGDLKWFGLDPGLASAAGSRIDSPNSVARGPQWDDFSSKVSIGAVAGFYATHPDRWMGLLSRSVEGMTRPTLGYLGSYPADAGQEPFAKEQRITVATSVLGFWGVAPAVLLLLLALTFVLGLVTAARAACSAAARALGRLGVITVIAAVTQAGAEILSEGSSEIYKHMIMADLLALLCVPLLCGCVYALASSSARAAR
ncbi:hypothetical protein CU254_28725 [Amycolatopsis sp. AA4]|uniref:glycan biosynthesis hexose transferase WsfD n=1 Tax=Actinomycetes TaxID=1760 RepID=UPI0001B5408F|nr:MULTISPECIES: hypothetical protein [Actinomycetes]ATY13964.1 hypothetical protein CU254_28725 [Amycolatopsis sp. AA4]EFL09982.1 hypothetical protein SSMG_05653 [Streptomyces sp. AA4]